MQLPNIRLPHAAWFPTQVNVVLQSCSVHSGEFCASHWVWVPVHVAGLLVQPRPTHCAGVAALAQVVMVLVQEEPSTQAHPAAAWHAPLVAHAAHAVTSGLQLHTGAPLLDCPVEDARDVKLLEGGAALELCAGSEDELPGTEVVPAEEDGAVRPLDGAAVAAEEPVDEDEDPPASEVLEDTRLLVALEVPVEAGWEVPLLLAREVLALEVPAEDPTALLVDAVADEPAAAPDDAPVVWAAHRPSTHCAPVTQSSEVEHALAGTQAEQAVAEQPARREATNTQHAPRVMAAV